MIVISNALGVLWKRCRRRPFLRDVTRDIARNLAAPHHMMFRNSLMVD